MDLLATRRRDQHPAQADPIYACSPSLSPGLADGRSRFLPRVTGPSANGTVNPSVLSLNSSCAPRLTWPPPLPLAALSARPPPSLMTPAMFLHSTSRCTLQAQLKTRNEGIAAYDFARSRSGRWRSADPGASPSRLDSRPGPLAPKGLALTIEVLLVLLV